MRRLSRSLPGISVFKIVLLIALVTLAAAILFDDERARAATVIAVLGLFAAGSLLVSIGADLTARRVSRPAATPRLTPFTCGWMITVFGADGMARVAQCERGKHDGAHSVPTHGLGMVLKTVAERSGATEPAATPGTIGRPLIEEVIRELDARGYVRKVDGDPTVVMGAGNVDGIGRVAGHSDGISAGPSFEILDGDGEQPGSR